LGQKKSGPLSKCPTHWARRGASGRTNKETGYGTSGGSSTKQRDAEKSDMSWGGRQPFTGNRKEGTAGGPIGGGESRGCEGDPT